MKYGLFFAKTFTSQSIQIKQTLSKMATLLTHLNEGLLS